MLSLQLVKIFAHVLTKHPTSRVNIILDLFSQFITHFYYTYKSLFSGYFCIFFCKGNSYFSTSSGTKFRIVQKKHPISFEIGCKSTAFF